MHFFSSSKSRRSLKLTIILHVAPNLRTGGQAPVLHSSRRGAEFRFLLCCQKTPLVDSSKSCWC
jgi:hypothetical protein